MVAICVPVSREDLLLNFVKISGDVTDNLRTIIVGIDYAVHTADVSDETGLIGQYNSGSGVSSSWPDLGADETVDLGSPTAFVSNGLVRYYQQTGAPGVTDGSKYPGYPNRIQSNGGATIFTGPGFTGSLNVAVAVGDFVRLDDNGVNSFNTTVTGFGYVTGSPTVLILADDLPSWATSGNFNITLAEIVTSQALSSSDLTTSTSTVQADAGITLATNRTGSAYALVAYDTYSQIYVSYRAFRDVLPDDGVISVSTVDELSSYFVDTTDPSAGLGFAVRHALAPETDPEQDDPPAVLFIAVASDTAQDWQTAVNLIQRRRDWYTVAPLTSDTDIQTIFTTLMTARTELGLNSRLFLALELVTEEIVFSGSATVTVDQSSTPGFNRTITRTGGASAPFTGAVAGDYVTVNGTTVIIASVISGQSATVTSNLTGGAGQTLTSIVHPMSIQEQADDYAERTADFDSDAISVIFPPDPTWNGESVEGYLLAAAAAGLRGYTAPQQSLSGVLMEEGWGVAQAGFDFSGAITDLIDAGCFVFDAPESDPERAVIIAPDTTDPSSTLTKTEDIVANQDAVRRFVKDIIACYEGRTKTTSATLLKIRQSIAESFQNLVATTNIDPFGPVILSGTVGAPYVSPNNATTIIVPAEITIPAGISSVVVTIDVVLQVSV